MPVLPFDCHLLTQYTTHTIKLYQWTNNKRNKGYKQLIYIYIHISCKCDTNRAGHFTLDAHASRPVACPYCIWNAACRCQVIDLRTAQVYCFAIFWHVDTRPISPFLFFFNSTFYLCIIIVIFTWCIWYINWSCWQSYITLSVLMF